MKKAEVQALQTRIVLLEHQNKELARSLAWQLHHNAVVRDWNRKARRLMGLWMKAFYHGHPAHPPVGSTRSHLKEW